MFLNITKIKKIKIMILIVKKVYGYYHTNTYRANLIDDRLQSLLVIGVTDFNPNYKEILQKKSTVPSVPLKFA